MIKPKDNEIDSSNIIQEPVIPPIIDTILVDSSHYQNGNIPNENIFLCQSSRFGRTTLYSEAELEQKSGIYGVAADYQNNTQNLNYEFFAPANDTLHNRPFILLVHEGAFLFGDLGAELGKARLLAQKGYAVAVINYRLGYEGGSESNFCGGSSGAVLRALYRAVQDTKAALRYFASNSNSFGIDTDQFFLAGSSAGSMTITALNYMTESDFEQREPGIVQQLGSLNSSGNSLSGNYRIRALLTYLGFALVDVAFITPANVKPMLMFQGSQDNVLPYDSGPLYSCGGYFTTYGSKPTTQRLRELGQPYEWIVQSGSGHITSYSTQYITERYAEFIKKLWCNDLRQITISDTSVIENIKLN